MLGRLYDFLTIGLPNNPSLVIPVGIGLGAVALVLAIAVNALVRALT